MPIIPSRRSYMGLSVFFSLVGVLLIILVIWQGNSQPQSSTTEWIPIIMQQTIEVNPEEDTLLSVPGEKVDVLVPANAIESSGSIFIVKREANLFPEVDRPDWYRWKILNIEYHNQAGSIIENPIINSPIEICFGLSDTQWESYWNWPGDFVLQRYDESLDKPGWISLDTYPKRETFSLCSQITRLGLIALATKETQPNLPVTGDQPYSP